MSAETKLIESTAVPNAAQPYGVVPVEWRAETVHSMQATSASVRTSVFNSALSALAAWKAAA